MGKAYKYKFKWGFTWNIEKLEKWMSDLSAKGIHIEKPGFLRNRVSLDSSQKYIYRMDFQQELSDQQKLKDYIGLFADDGWEHIGSVGPLWHYFRKNSRSNEPYELYTDRSSLAGYYKRIRKVIFLVSIINFPLMLININSIFSNPSKLSSIILPLASLQFLIILFMVYGYFRFGQIIKALGGDSGEEII